MGTYRRNAFALGRPGEGVVDETAQLSTYSDHDFAVPLHEGDNSDDEGGTRTSSCHLTEEQITAFREVFNLFDSNGGGTIDAEELDLALRSVDIQLSTDDLQEVLSVMDKDGNGEIDFSEFLNLMTNTERFLESFSGGKGNRKREHLLFEALTQFMKRSALHSINEIVGFYHTKYKRIQAPHVVGHYAAGARVIGLTETQLRRHMETLKARHAAGDNKSPYAEPLHIVFGKVVRPKKRRQANDERVKFTEAIEIKQTMQGMGQPRGRIRPRFQKLSIQPSPSNPNLPNKSPVVQSYRNAISPAARLLMRRQGKQEQPPKPLKKDGWVSQRIKPFSVDLPAVQVKSENKASNAVHILTFDDLPKIREKVSQAREVHFKRLRETKNRDGEEHWKALGPDHINSELLRNYFRLAFNAYTPHITIKST